MENKKRADNFFRKTGALLLAFLFFCVTVFPQTAFAEDPKTEETGLPVNETQASQVETLGLPSEQLSRYAENGEEIDKGESPFGHDNLTMFQIRQLAISTKTGLSLWKNPLGISPVNSMENAEPYLKNTYPAGWSNGERTTVAADVDGNGLQEVVTMVLVRDLLNLSLVLSVTNYDGTDTTKTYSVVSSIDADADSDYRTKELRAAAGDFNKDGKDEVAIVAGRNVYVCKADMTSCTILSKTCFNSANVLAKIPDSVTPEIELCAGDADGDAYPELLLFTGSVYGAAYNEKTYTLPTLLIYDGTDLTKPTANIVPSENAYRAAMGEEVPTGALSGGSPYFSNASIDVGDLFGEGENRIVLGGRLNPVGYGLSSVKYDAANEEYLVGDLYTLAPEKYAAVKSTLLGLKCVSFQVLATGDPEYTVLGGFVYKYDKAEDEFTEVQITSAKSNTDGNNVTKSMGSITNVNYKKDETYILDMVVGGFDEGALTNKNARKPGQEQLIMLHYNKWYSNEYLYVTAVTPDKDGNLTARLSSLWNKDDDDTVAYYSICAPDIYNRGLRLTFEADKSEFIFSNPSVIAILGATPYYSELKDETLALGNAGTTYGTDTTTEDSESNGVTASVSASVGFHHELSALGQTLEEFTIETTVTSSFTSTWTTAKSISKSLSFTGYYSDDMVVVMVVPYDMYYFTVYNTETKTTDEMIISIPYSPITQPMPLTQYNAASAKIENAPIIGPDVLAHTVGDPRTYPSSSEDVDSSGDVLIGGTAGTEAECFVSCGTGNATVEQGITTTSTSKKTYDYSTDVNVSFNAGSGGFTAGVSAGVGYVGSVETSSSESTIRLGQVASVPTAYSNYQFNWCLAAYNSDLKAGLDTQTCTVINYLVKPIGAFPPKVPANLKVQSRSLAGTLLSWDPAYLAGGYKVSRSASADGTYAQIADLTGLTTTNYNDTTAPAGTAYYYKVEAYSGARKSMPAYAIASARSVSGITIKTQPLLIYNEGDTLDLTNLAVTLKYSDSGTEDIGFAQFPSGVITASPTNSSTLASSQSGTPISVKYVPTNLSANTGAMTVYADSPYALALNAIFNVGSTKNAKALAANQKLEAYVTLQNQTTTAQPVLVIVALYSDKGTMVSIATQAVNVAASGTSTVTIAPAFTLPASVSGYKVKVFAWDGSSFSSTIQTPKSNVVQL